jgi:hypothetical protein
MRIGVTTGADFADALSAASRLAPKHAPLILTRPQSLPVPSAAKLEEYAFYGPVEIFGGPSAVSDQVANQAGVLVLPSTERAISLGEQVEVELDAAESIALSFEATKGDQLLVTVDGADDVVAANLFSPGLTKIGLSSILGGGNRPWDLYDPLVESGTFRLVFYSEYSDQQLNIVVSRPVDLPEHEIVPDGGPVNLTFGPGQAATLTYQSVADAGAVLHVTQPSTMCAQLAVRNANGALLVADRPCGAKDMRYDVRSQSSGKVVITFDPVYASHGSVSFELRSVVDIPDIRISAETESVELDFDPGQRGVLLTESSPGTLLRLVPVLNTFDVKPTVGLYNPHGRRLIQAPMPPALPWPRSVPVDSIALTGDYRVMIDPVAATEGSAAFNVERVQVGPRIPLVPGGASVPIDLDTGDARNLDLSIDLPTTYVIDFDKAIEGCVSVRVFNPDASLNKQQVCAGDYLQFAATTPGSYTVVVDAERATGSGQITLQARTA